MAQTRVRLPQASGHLRRQTLASRYGADPSAADWRRFGRLPGFTNCKPKYRKPDGLFPFVRLKNHAGEQYPMAEAFAREITQMYAAREQEREARRKQASLSPRRDRGPVAHPLSVSALRQIPGPTRRRRHRLLCRSDCRWHDRRPDRTFPRRRLPLPRSQPFQTNCLHPKNHDEGEEMSRAVGRCSLSTGALLEPIARLVERQIDDNRNAEVFPCGSVVSQSRVPSFFYA